MKVDERALQDVHTVGGGETPPCVGLTSNTLPKAQSDVFAESSQTGVSTRNAHKAVMPKAQKKEDGSHWYVLRTTYGREKKAYDYLTTQGVMAFYPTINSVKLINGKRKVVTESRLPNIFFAYGTEEQLKTFVYDNANLSFLRFYYHHTHIGNRIEKTPLIVPDYQMESLKIACASEEDDVIIVSGEIQKFEKGQLVRVVKGEFEGFMGIVARHKGQQRVGIVVNNLLTVMTAYVPSAYCEILDNLQTHEHRQK